MPKVTLAGHPLYPMLIVAPAALIPFSFVLDAMYRATGKKSYANAAYYGIVGAVLGGLAAGAAGASDYLTIPSRSPVKRTANLHALLNVSVLALMGLDILSRQKSRNHEGGSLLLSFASALGVITSGWFGERMVYEQGMRVEGVSPVEGAPEARLPDDRCLASGLLRLENIAPGRGPSLTR